MSHSTQYLKGATARELEDYLKQYLWVARDNYTGKTYTNHAIIHMTHDLASLEEQANYLTLVKEQYQEFVFPVFNHWRYGTLEMVLVPIRAAYETLRYAALTHQELMGGEILDPLDLAEVEEEAMEALWNNLSADEKEAFAIEAGKNDVEARIERAQVNPDMFHSGTIMLLQKRIYEI